MAFIALRAFPSCVEMTGTVSCVLEKSFFFLALLVWSGESSTPIPRDHAKYLSRVSVWCEEEVPTSVEGAMSSFPRNTGNWVAFSGRN
jgi:hypothetical protein